MPRPKTSRRHTVVMSFVVRVVKQRTTQERVVYELLEIASGTLHRFDSLAAINRFIRRHADRSLAL